jgi:hypothetical protein
MEVSYLRFQKILYSGMTLIITPGMTAEEIHQHAREMRKKLQYDFTKLCGTLKLDEDPLTIQKKLRDEWS